MNEIQVAFNALSQILSINFTIVGFSVNFFMILVTLLLCSLVICIIGYILGD